MDGTYAPQSPDLSSFFSSPSKQPHPQSQIPQQPNVLNAQSIPQRQQSYQPAPSAYAPRSPVIPPFNHQTHPQAQFHTFQSKAPSQNFSSNGGREVDNTNTYMPPIPALPPSHSFASNAPGTHPTSFSSSATPGRGAAPRAHPIKNEPYESKLSMSAPQPSAYKDPNPNNIIIKTKFPVARIKRIMQADEEVGKVAQVTPVAVSKALELFMIALVGGAAEKAKDKGSKRVTAQHLKMVVQGDEQFDFLTEIVGKVADVQEGAGGEGRKRKSAGKVEKDEDSDSEEDRKPKKGKGRRKKADMDD